MTIRRMNNQRFKQALLMSFGDAIRKPRSAALGFIDHTGTRYLKVPDEDSDQPNRYYFHELGGQSFQGQAILKDGSLAKKEIRYGMPIRIKKDELTGNWVIIGRDPELGAEFMDNVEDERLVVESDQIALGLLTETVPQSMQARVIGGAYTYENTWRFIETQLTIDYSAQVPATNGNARYVLVQIAYETGTLSYKYGAEVSSAPTYQQIGILDGGTGIILPQPDPGAFFRAGYVKLVAGMTAITKASHIWAIQEFLFKRGDPVVDLDDIIPAIVTACGEVVTIDGAVVWESLS